MHIVHRDLKPDNILISPNGHLAVGDFGFAKSFSGKRWANARMTEPLGTAGYIAPEMLDHHLPTVGYSHSIDVWGYGIILLEMLIGKVVYFHLFGPDSFADLILDHIALYRRGLRTSAGIHELSCSGRNSRRH
jgi:serine/threonine protein kinase